MNFWYYQIWTSADTLGLNSGLSLNLHLFFMYGNRDGPGKSIQLHGLV